MIKQLPGTTVELGIRQVQAAGEFLDNIFACGGLMLSQVSSLTGLEPYVIQNWVKRGFLAPAKKKLYTKRQFCRILLINMLRESLQIEKIVGLLSYINGHLDDESDDQIDDTVLYLYCVTVLLALADSGGPSEGFRDIIEQTVADYAEPFPGGRRRLVDVLEVMAFAYCSAQYRKWAERCLRSLDHISKEE